MLILICLGLALMAVAGIFRPFLGLLGLLMINVVQPGELYPVLAAFHVERVLAALVLISFFAHGHRLVFPKITRSVLYFWSAMFLACPLAIWRANALSTTIEFGQIVVYHLMIVALVDEEDRVKRFLVVFAGLTGWLAASSLYLYSTGKLQVAMGIERAVGLTSAGGDPNRLGITLVTSIPLVALLLSRESSKRLRLLAGGVITISIATLIATGSRTSFFALLVALLLWTLGGRSKLMYTSVAVLLVLLLWFLIPEQYKNRYKTVESLNSDDSYQNRLTAWRAGWAMFRANPLTGMGPGNYAMASGTRYWPRKDHKLWLNAHSLFFKTIGELGIVGFIAFLNFIVVHFRLNRWLKAAAKALPSAGSLVRDYPSACATSLLLLLFTGYSSHNLYRNTWYMLAALSGAMQQIVLDMQLKATTGKEEALVSVPAVACTEELFA